MTQMVGRVFFVCLFVLNISVCLLYSGEVLHYWRFHFWRILSHWYRISLSLYPNEILSCSFCQQDRLGIWPPCSCDQECFLWGHVKMVISLSDSHIPLRALRWGHEVWAVTQCSVEKHCSVLEKEIDHSITYGWWLCPHWHIQILLREAFNQRTVPKVLVVCILRRLSQS